MEKNTNAEIAKARAENNEGNWRMYGEWRGQIQARSEEAKRLEKKLEDLKKLIEDKGRKEAEKAVLEGGND